MEPSSPARRLRAWPYWPVVAWVLGVKALVLVHGAFTYLVPWEQSLADARAFFEIWNRWDSLNYMHIAEFGYEASGEMKHLLAFYPLFPALIRALAPLCGSFLAAGFWISTLTSVSAAILFHRLVHLDRPEDASRAVFFLLVFPTSYFLHIPYTESLFLTFCFGSLLSARARRWALAGLLGACAALTRINGLALSAALLLEVALAWREEKRFRPQWLLVLMAPVGAIGFLVVNLLVAGDPFAFVRHQHDHFHRTLDWPWTGYVEIWKAFLRRASSEAFVMRSQELLFATLMVAGSIVSVLRLRASYAAYMIVNTALILGFTHPWAVPRYALILFPLYLMFARIGRRPLVFALLTAWSLLFLAFFSSLFVRGFWAF